jgi:hypothetical protein
MTSTTLIQPYFPGELFASIGRSFQSQTTASFFSMHPLTEHSLCQALMEESRRSSPARRFGLRKAGKRIFQVFHRWESLPSDISALRRFARARPGTVLAHRSG